VVVEPAPVVPDGILYDGRKAVETPENVFGRDSVELGVSLESGVELRGVSTVVLLVVDLHGSGIDVGLKGVVGIPELRKLEGIGHWMNLLFINGIVFGISDPKVCTAPCTPI
jgi:hypothetical protein